MMRLPTFLLSALTVLALHSPVQAAEDYPSKPITIVVSLAAGTGMDVVTRLYAEKLSQALGKPAAVVGDFTSHLVTGLSDKARAIVSGYYRTSGIDGPRRLVFRPKQAPTEAGLREGGICSPRNRSRRTAYRSAHLPK